jgi:predicted ATPase
MEIQELEVKGFRSLRNVRWTPGRLNVLIGPNGSGKSNLLQALEFLKRAAENKLSDEILRQGGIAALLWDTKAQEISWNLKAIFSTPVQDCSEGLYQLNIRQVGLGSSFRIENEMIQIGGNAFLNRRSVEARIVDIKGASHAIPLVYDDQSALEFSRIIGPPAGLFYLGLTESAFYHGLRVDREAPARQAAIARLERRLSSDGQNLIPVLHTWMQR